MKKLASKSKAVHIEESDSSVAAEPLTNQKEVKSQNKADMEKEI